MAMLYIGFPAQRLRYVQFRLADAVLSDVSMTTTPALLSTPLFSGWLSGTEVAKTGHWDGVVAGRSRRAGLGGVVTMATRLQRTPLPRTRPPVPTPSGAAAALDC